MNCPSGLLAAFLAFLPFMNYWALDESPSPAQTVAETKGKKPMSQFILLLHENPADFADLSPEAMQGVIAEYRAWRLGLEAAGKCVIAHKLKDEGGRRLSSRNGHVRVVDGPYAEAKEVVGGFFVIKAGDYDEAVEMSKSCPHLKYGGQIEIRQMELHVE